MAPSAERGMVRPRMRGALATLGAALALLGAASAASGGATQRLRPAGVVPHTAPGRPALRSRSQVTRSAGPSFLTVDASYESLIDRYLADVAHDSGGTANVYSIATQYSDGSGPIRYESAFGGSYVDHGPLPANGCDDSFGGVSDPTRPERRASPRRRHRRSSPSRCRRERPGSPAGRESAGSSRCDAGPGVDLPPRTASSGCAARAAGSGASRSGGRLARDTGSRRTTRATGSGCASPPSTRPGPGRRSRAPPDACRPCGAASWQAAAAAARRSAARTPPSRC
jgi:hypothetical protein